MGQRFLIVPDTGSSGELSDDGTGNLRLATSPSAEISLSGLLLTGGIKNPTPTNRCSQNLADVAIKDEILTINSEMACFLFAIVSDPVDMEEVEMNRDYILSNFDSLEAWTLVPDWEVDRDYPTPFRRIRLADVSGNACQYYYPRWYDHWPHVQMEFPHTLHGSTLT